MNREEIYRWFQKLNIGDRARVVFGKDQGVEVCVVGIEFSFGMRGITVVDGTGILRLFFFAGPFECGSPERPLKIELRPIELDGSRGIEHPKREDETP
jgi:hypothetical protein